jgi:hypothetical protein
VVFDAVIGVGSVFLFFILTKRQSNQAAWLLDWLSWFCAFDL